MFPHIPPSVLLSQCLLFTSILASNTIDWFQCEQNGSLPLTCGTLMVPLDYLNTASDATLKLELVKISAVKEPKMGTILINPGGPGGSGRETLAGDLATSAQIATGGFYDLIGFDPRGTGNTIPFSCYTDPAERASYNLKQVVLLNSSDTAIGTAWAVRKTLAESCYNNAKDIGEIVGTGYVARDMMQIVDALDEGSFLNFWGFSYGSVLGATAAALFPDRMGKIVLDGVIDPREYYAGISVKQYTDSDACFDGFFTSCVASPENCALAQNGSTAEGLKREVYALLERVKYEPLVAGGNAGTDIIDYNMVKYVIFGALYIPANWPALALGLNMLFTGNYTAFPDFVASASTSPTIYPNNGFEAVHGIRASDTTLRTDNLTSLYPILEAFFDKSRIAGDVLSYLTLEYAQWPFKAKGAYTGNFYVKTSNPILFVGNTYDPVTSLAGAKSASAGFDGSVVLENVAYGHTSISQASLCTAKAIRTYFVNGTLPAKGTKCPVDVPLFTNETTAEFYAPYANVSKRALSDEDGDAALLSAIKRLGESIPYRAF